MGAVVIVHGLLLAITWITWENQSDIEMPLRGYLILHTIKIVGLEACCCIWIGIPLTLAVAALQGRSACVSGYGLASDIWEDYQLGAMGPRQVGTAVWKTFWDLDIQNFWGFQKKALVRSVFLTIMAISGYNLCQIGYEKGKDKARQDLRGEKTEAIANEHTKAGNISEKENVQKTSPKTQRSRKVIKSKRKSR